MTVMIPHWDDLPTEVRDRLVSVADSHIVDISVARKLTHDFYKFLYYDMLVYHAQKEHRENASPTRSS